MMSQIEMTLKCICGKLVPYSMQCRFYTHLLTRSYWSKSLSTSDKIKTSDVYLYRSVWGPSHDLRDHRKNTSLNTYQTSWLPSSYWLPNSYWWLKADDRCQIGRTSVFHCQSFPGSWTVNIFVWISAQVSC